MRKLNLKVWPIISLLLLIIVLSVGCSNSKIEEESNDKEISKTQESTSVGEGDSKVAEETENSETETKDSMIEKKIDINIASLKGPTSMGLVKVMENAKNGESANNYNFTIAGAADEITAGIIKGDYDIAAIPANLASVLYNKSEGGLVVAGINTLGVLYIVETGEQIESVADLKGKTIYSTGKGTTPEYTLNYLLTSNGIDPQKDVTIEYKSEATEVAAILSEAEDAIAMLPQPYVTTVLLNNEKVHIALDVAKEWENASTNGSTVTTGVVVINKEFLKNHKEEVDLFLDEYEDSATYVNEHVEEASALIEKFDIFKAAVAKLAIPECNITLIQGEDMQTKLSGYLEVLNNQNPNSIGGNLPGEDFYYKR